jgi:CubicO group peptidase (beta-lactamase class C family)
MARITRRQALACGALSVPLLSRARGDDASERKTAVDKMARAALKAWDVPGLALGIVKDGKVIYLEGHGVKEIGKENPVTLETLFPIASCTKAFTTTALAMLVGERRMRWDDPVRDHLDYFRLADPSADRLVTIRDLLCHRTGLASHDLLWYHAAWSPREAVRRIARLAPELQFRSSFQYQSTMVAAAGYALEAALGKGATKEAKDATWEGFVRERILNPLGMTRTFCTFSEGWQQDNVAVPHRRDRKRKIQPIERYETKWPDPAGSIVSCARDFCEWALFHLREGKAVQGGREVELVKQEALADTHSPQNIIAPPIMDRQMYPESEYLLYCMGWVRQDYRGHWLTSHAGLIDGFRTHVTLVPKHQLGIVLLANLHGTHLNQALCNTLVDYFLKLTPTRDWNAYLGKIIEERDKADEKVRQDRETNRARGTKHSRELPAYAGTFREPVFGDAVVKYENEKLWFEWSTFKCPLEHFHYDTFVIKDEILHDPFVNFSLGFDGSVVTLSALNRYFIRIK